MFPDLALESQPETRSLFRRVLHLLLIGLPFAFCVHAIGMRIASIVAGTASLWSFVADAGLLVAMVGAYALGRWFDQRCYDYGVDRAKGPVDQISRAFNALFGREGLAHFDMLHQAAIEDARERLLSHALVEPRTQWGRIVSVRPTWVWNGISRESQEAGPRFTIYGAALPERLQQSRYEVIYAGGDVIQEDVYQDVLPDLMLACGQDLDATLADVVYPHYFGHPTQQESQRTLSDAWNVATG